MTEVTQLDRSHTRCKSDRSFDLNSEGTGSRLVPGNATDE